jgi:uncharacterized repeat protein (TIGR02543 family)
MTSLASLSRHVLSFGAIVALVVGGAVSASSPSPAVAAPVPSTLSVYLDAPFVQGSYVAAAGGADVLAMNFNASTFDGQFSCGHAAPPGITVTGTCSVFTARAHAGATADVNVATPTVGGAGSSFASTTHSTNPVIISLANESRYLGFWWPSGSTNTLKFFKDSTELLTMTTNDIITKVGSDPGGSWGTLNNDNAGNVITSIGPSPSSYRKVWYYGNPRGYASTTPTSASTETPSQPFVYLHLIAAGNFTFNRVEFSGDGFEFDNLAVATSAPTADPRLVLVSQLTSSQKAVAFEPNGSGVQGAMSNQVGNSSAALTANAFTRSGFTFDGWATAADGSGTRYADAASYSFAADMTLYAQWIDNSPPASGGGSAPPATVETLAATGSNTAGLVGVAVSSVLVGLALVAMTARYRRTQSTFAP